MEKVRSKDGTSIAYDRLGIGPALILVTGAIAHRSDAASVATRLSHEFNVYAYDRRGRGDSGDTQPYAVEKEVEDIDALISSAGGSTYLFGHSSGAVLAMEAARLLPIRVKKLVVYEPPFIVEGSRPPFPEGLAAQLIDLLSKGRRSDMLELWMAQVGTPEQYITQMRQQPGWHAMEAVAPTLLYDLTIMKGSMTGHPLPPELVQRLASIKALTLVLAGGASPDWARYGARAAAQAIPGSEYRVLEGQTHGVSDDALVPVLVEFLKKK